MPKYLAKYRLNIQIIQGDGMSTQPVHSECEFGALNDSEARIISQNYLPTAEIDAYRKGERTFDCVVAQEGHAILEKLLRIEEIPLAQSRPT